MSGTTKEIKTRIKSVESTKQITKAMQLVASSKFTRAKERMERSRPFFTTLYEATVNLASSLKNSHSIFAIGRKEIKKTCYIIIAGDRGLAGGFNNNIFNLATEEISDKNVVICPIGKRSLDFFQRKGQEILTDDFSIIGDINIGDCYVLATQLTNKYKAGEFDAIKIVYTNFVSILSQEPAIAKILPLSLLSKPEEKTGYTIFEPSDDAILDAIVPSYIGGMIWGAVCESTASEFAARRCAMESATNNAEEIIDDLKLKYNRVRQGAITQEITEIVAGSNA